jgi:hypothetical protein
VIDGVGFRSLTVQAYKEASRGECWEHRRVRLHELVKSVRVMEHTLVPWLRNGSLLKNVWFVY